MTILKDISIFWSLSHTLVLFMILFESRFPKRKTMILTLSTMVPLIVVNGILALFINPEQFGTILLLTISLPSLIFFLIMAKKRDGRFFFTFCMVDTVVLEVMYISQVINFHTTPNSYLVMFLIRILSFPLIEVIMYRKLRKPYHDLQIHTRRGWWLFAAISVLFYITLSLFMNTPTSITERPEDYPVMILLFIMMPLIYLHFITTLLRQQHAYESNEQESILRLQTANIIARVEELSEASERFREERHNFRHKLKTIASLVEKKQYDELELLVAEYTDTIKKTQIIRYCDNAVIDAVLSTYIKQAEHKGIKLDLGFAFPEVIPVSTTELATVFANAIENAINACERLPESERFIQIKVLSKPKFMIMIKNSFNGEVEFDSDDIPVNEEEGHGFGTRSIVAFCKKAGGTCDFVADKKEFTLYIHL